MGIKRIIAGIIVVAMICLIFTSCSGTTQDVNSGPSNTSSENISPVGAKFTKGENGCVAAPANKITTFENQDTVVMCWGASLTAGMAVGEDYDYPVQLQANLAGQFKVMNAGVAGKLFYMPKMV